MSVMRFTSSIAAAVLLFCAGILVVTPLGSKAGTPDTFSLVVSGPDAKANIAALGSYDVSFDGGELSSCRSSLEDEGHSPREQVLRPYHRCRVDRQNQAGVWCRAPPPLRQGPSGVQAILLEEPEQLSEPVRGSARHWTDWLLGASLFPASGRAGYWVWVQQGGVPGDGGREQVHCVPQHRCRQLPPG